MRGLSVRVAVRCQRRGSRSVCVSAVLISTRAVICLFIIGVTVLVRYFISTRVVTYLFVIGVTVSIRGLVGSGSSTVPAQGQGPYAYRRGILSYQFRTLTS